jgi:hypothetical protein
MWIDMKYAVLASNHSNAVPHRETPEATKYPIGNSSTPRNIRGTCMRLVY